MSETTRTLAILVKAIGTAEASRKLKGVNRDVSEIGATAGKGLRTAGTNLLQLGTIAAGVTAVGLVGAVKAAGDFEAQLNTINTVAMVSAKDLEAIGASVRKIARDTGTPLADLTSAYYDLVSAGVSAKDATNVLTTSNTLAIGGLATVTETVNLLTTAINAYGGDASKATIYADQFAVAIRNGKVTASELAASFSVVGPLAASMNVGIDQIAASVGLMTSQGTPAAEAMTDMRAAMVALQRTTPALDGVLKSLGITNVQAELNAKGLAGIWNELGVKAAKLGIPIIDLTGRVEGTQYVLQNTGPAFERYTKNLNDVRNASGTAAAQMGQRQQGLNYTLARIKSNALDLAIVLGNKLLPKLTPLADRAIAFLSAHQDDIAAFGDKIAAGFDSAVKFAEKIPWASVGEGLKTAADWAGKLISVFTSLPPEAQAMIIGLAGLNKLTGGAVGGIVGELGKGLIKGVLGMTAGVVNLRAGVVNGGAGGAAGAAGAAGGGGKLGMLGKGLAVAGAALSIGELIQTFQQVNAQSTAQAQDVNRTLRASLETSPPLTDLQTKLAAINTGIAEMRANPLLVLVQGDALNELQRMRSEVTAAIDRGTATSGATSREDRDALYAAARAMDSLERNRLNQAINVNVSVDITARAIGNQQLQLARVGNLTRLGIF